MSDYETLPDDVLAVLDKYAPPAPLGDDDLTIEKAAKKWGVSITSARRLLRIALEDGSLVEEQRTGKNGQHKKIYVLPESN